MKYLHELLKNEFEDRIVSVKIKLIDIIWLTSQENHYWIRCEWKTCKNWGMA